MKIRTTNCLALLLVYFACSQAARTENLQGGIQQKATVHPGVTLFSGSSATAPLEGGTGVVQFSGGARMYQGRPAPYLHSQVPSVSSANPYLQSQANNLQSQLAARSGAIPALTTYTLAPGIKQYGLEPYVTHTPSTVSHGVSYWGEAGSNTTTTTVKAVQSRSGVSTYEPGLEVTSVPATPVAQPSGLVCAFHQMHGSLPCLCNGKQGWSPKPEEREDPKVEQLVGDRRINSGVVSTPVTTSNSVSFSRGGEVNVYSKHAGISTYAPGYSVTINSPNLKAETLSGKWSTNLPKELTAQPLGVTAQTPPFEPTYVNIQRLPEEKMATTMAMPMSNKPSASWHDWFHDVAQVIYAHWQYADVGVGTAKLSVTVTPERIFSAQVIDFIPAEGVPRNVKVETKFRESALAAANKVEAYTVPQFPTGGTSKPITFDIDMRRTVDGPAGARVETR